MSVPTFPLTAWEQAVIVVIFAVILLVLAGGVFAFIRWVLRWAREREMDWQRFITQLRKDDVTIRREDQRRNEESAEGTQEILGKIAEAMNAMTTRLEVHDQQAKVILEKVNHIDEQITRPLTRKRND